MEIEITKIKPNLNNARKYFDKISELAEDIKKHGLIQKIAVRPIKNGFYEIIQGERRFRALKLLGSNNLDCEVMNISEEEASKISLAENIQREDLSVVELAEEFKKRLKKTTQQKLSKEINKSQPYISLVLKVLQLPKSIQQIYFIEKKLNKEHANKLLECQKYLVNAFGFDDWNVEYILTQFAWWSFLKKWDSSQLNDAIMGNLTARILGCYYKKGDIMESWNSDDWKAERDIIINGAKLKSNKYSIELITKIFKRHINNCNHIWTIDEETGEEYCEDCGKSFINEEKTW